MLASEGLEFLAEGRVGDLDEGPRALLDALAVELGDTPLGDHGLDVELSKAATISGTVTDEEGKPIQGVTVIAWQIMGIDGRKGSLEPGKDADLVAFDEGIRVALVMVGGEIRLEAL